jgi:RNA polymerase sigma-70 factor (ECF subfamily)
MGLTAQLLAHAGPARQRLAAEPALETILDDLWRKARAAWPAVVLSSDAFMRHVAERLPPDEQALAALRDLPAPDLYLAAACLARDPVAMTAFDQRFLVPVVASLGRRGRSAAVTDEIQQVLRTRMLVGVGQGGPRIAAYTGRGPLDAWVRMAAARVAVDLHRAHIRGLKRPADMPDPVMGDPELVYFQRHYGHVFREAFQASLQELSDREAAMVQMYFLEEATAKQIARVFQVTHRSVRRWVREAREKILESTRARLMAQLDVSGEQLESVIRLVQDGPPSRLVDLLRRVDPPG